MAGFGRCHILCIPLGAEIGAPELSAGDRTFYQLPAAIPRGWQKKLGGGGAQNDKRIIEKGHRAVWGTPIFTAKVALFYISVGGDRYILIKVRGIEIP